MKKTKIICTLGPATGSDEMLAGLVSDGMNAARINLSHGNHDDNRDRINRIVNIRKSRNLPIAIIADIQGPKVRIGKFADGRAEIIPGQEFVLTTDECQGSSSRVSVSYKSLTDRVFAGNRILIADGLIELKVRTISGNDIHCEVISGGEIGNNKSVNIPDGTIDLPFISDKDKNDILFSIESRVEYIASSFVRTAEDLIELRSFLSKNGGDFISLIAKIENKQGVQNIDDIIKTCDGVMIARGDMGVEIPFEELPHIQKDIIQRCNTAGKTVITATQMLESMIQNPRPTRAEITDVANAIYDGTSAIMLSGETSIGKYPREAVKTMTKIAAETEKKIDYRKRFISYGIPNSRNVTNAICHATCDTAHMLDAGAIISVTETGHTALGVSKYRPMTRIIAPTVSEHVYHKLSLAWGVTPVLARKMNSTEEISRQALSTALSNSLINEGDLVIITGSAYPGMSGTTSMMSVSIVGDVVMTGIGVLTHAASGNACVIRDERGEIHDFTSGNILVIKNSTDGVCKIIKNAAAVITEEDPDKSKAVIIAKALDIPVIASAERATEIIKSGIVVTVDPLNGKVYSGKKNLQ
jgi:pyruvate kinase